MNIYLCQQSTNHGYDTYDSFVCYANDEDEAKHLYPNHNVKWTDETWKYEYSDGSQYYYSNNCWCMPEDVGVTLIGTTEDYVQVGVILASFNAG